MYEANKLLLYEVFALKDVPSEPRNQRITSLNFSLLGSPINIFTMDMTLSAREGTFKTLVTLQHPEGDDRFLKLT